VKAYIALVNPIQKERRKKKSRARITEEGIEDVKC
jgi:hypothetical protein